MAKTTAEQTNFTAYRIVEAVDVDVPSARTFNTKAGRQARKALIMAARLLRIRTDNGGTQVNILEDAVTLACASIRACEWIQEKSRDATERRRSERVELMARALVAFAKARFPDGSHANDTPLAYLKAAEKI